MGTAKERRVRSILERSKKTALKERFDERNGVSVLPNGQAEFRSGLKQSVKETQKEMAFRTMGLYATEHNENDKDDYSKNVRNFENGVPSNANVIVTRMNHLLEIQHMKTMNFKSHIKNLPKDEETGKRRYALIETGDIYDCDESDNRGENKNSLQKTFKKLRYLINNNFTGKANELHVTLTFRKKVYDTTEFYDIFDKFMKRLRYYYKKINKDVKIEYINVIEPHADGSWHCHLLLRFDGLEKVFISNDVMREEIWKQGFVTIRTLEKVDNIGAYLSAYLSDIDVTGENINSDMVVSKKVDGVEKKFLKGGRLHYYDVGVNIYRSSKGIIEPVRENMKYKDIKKEVGNVKPNYSSKKTIENENYSNEITYLQYNLKRK